MLGQPDAGERVAVRPRGHARDAQEAGVAAPEPQLLALVHIRHLLVHEVVSVTTTVHPATSEVLEEALFSLPLDHAFVGLRAASEQFVPSWCRSWVEMGVMYDA
ncbi:hypothetical protein GQ600_4107 [Phytophthora cactorum]|nr:hypothetical protein GQ600_4107 [Phytophthora cactorum]